MGAPRYWPAWACVATLGIHCVAGLAQTRSDTGPRSNLQNTLPRAPDTPRDGGAAQITPRPQAGKDVRADTPIRPTAIRIAGVKSIPFAEVTALFRPLLNQDTTVGALAKAVQQVEEHYADHGYALSYAYLPEQDFANGVVQVVAVEGYVNSLSLKGVPPHLEGKVRAVADHIVGERPLTTRTFQRYVSLLAKLPDVSVDANVPAPENDDGASPLELEVRHRRFTVSAAFDADHPGFEGLLTGNINGVTALGDRLSASVMAPRGTRDRSYYELDYALPLGSDGLALRANAYRYRGEPSAFTFNGAPVRQDYSEDRASVSLWYPFLLNARDEISGELGVFAARSGDVFTQPPLAGRLDDRASTRAWQASLSGNWQRKRSETGAELLLVHGLTCCGANQDVQTVDLDYRKARFSARRADEWGDDLFRTFVTAVVQRSPDWLPATERINFGGSYFGAGYDSGEQSGDSGWAIAAEISKRFQFDGALARVEPYLAADYARARLTGAGRPEPLQSAIVGVRLATRERFKIDIARARPVGARPFGETGRPWRWNVLASVKF